MWGSYFKVLIGHSEHPHIIHTVCLQYHIDGWSGNKNDQDYKELFSCIIDNTEIW